MKDDDCVFINRLLMNVAINKQHFYLSVFVIKTCNDRLAFELTVITAIGRHRIRRLHSHDCEPIRGL